MKDKINIAELLKDCPMSMELDCLMYDNLYLDKVEQDCRYPIGCYTIYDGCRTSVNFTEFGEFNSHGNAKCVIFPKGKNTWEGFKPPCQFKDGDIIADNCGNICIYKGGMCYDIPIRKLADYYCYRKYDDKFFIKEKDRHFGCITKLHLATEEEKKKLFDAIKANGYKWNTETKTLEKLIKPKFKVGDRIRHKTTNKEDVYEISKVYDDSYGLVDFTWMIYMKYQDQYELVPNKFDITTLKPFDKVLTRGTIHDVWGIDFFGYYKDGYFQCSGHCAFRYCIPYEGNEHLLNTTNDCDEFYKT